jgi:hypothetical protein
MKAKKVLIGLIGLVLAFILITYVFAQRPVSTILPAPSTPPPAPSTK